MRADKIIEFAKFIKDKFNGIYDPGYICAETGIKIRKINLNPNVYKAYTTNINGKPIISLNAKFTMKSQMVLCAHELGHALLHVDNYFNGFDGENSQQEYEANLFAVALLFNEDEFNVPLSSLSNYELKCVLDSNIKLNPNNELEYRYY